MATHKPETEDSPELTTLISTLEGEIVPRLLMLCQSISAVEVTDNPPRLHQDAGDVAELARLLLTHGPEMAFEFAEALRHRGAAQDRICLDLLIQAAHQLTEQWERQDLSYPQLMQGLGALQSVVKRYQ